MTKGGASQLSSFLVDKAALGTLLQIHGEKIRSAHWHIGYSVPVVDASLGERP
jgi:hypothetical protein